MSDDRQGRASVGPATATGSDRRPGGTALAQPAYQIIKDHVIEQISGGHWRDGEMIPSEQELVEQFSVSRMTVNRALRELTVEQLLHRVQGVGTFVAQRKYHSTTVQIRSIAHEIAERGHTHSAKVLTLETVQATAQQRGEFGLAAPATLYHSVLLHAENDVPIQIEDRHVNPALFPAYLEQDFTAITPNEYLTQVAPIQRVEFRIEALMPDEKMQAQLLMERHEPCLVLHRRTWSFGQVATAVDLWHPGSRYRFSGSF